MKKRQTFFYGLFLGALGCLYFLTTLFLVSSDDLIEYQEMMQKNSLSTQRKSFLNSKQQRTCVHKEIWLSKEDGRHKIAIESPYSEIVLVSQANSSSIQEKLKSIQLQCQEKLYYNQKHQVQDIRKIFAEEATFSYQDHLFIATQVTLASYTCNGHVLPLKLNKKQLTMKGKASKIYFNTNHTNFDFNAKDLKVHFMGAGYL